MYVFLTTFKNFEANFNQLINYITFVEYHNNATKHYKSSPIRD